MVRQILVLFIRNYLKFLTIRQRIGKLLLFEKSLKRNGEPSPVLFLGGAVDRRKMRVQYVIVIYFFYLEFSEIFQ